MQIKMRDKNMKEQDKNMKEQMHRRFQHNRCLACKAV